VVNEGEGGEGGWGGEPFLCFRGPIQKSPRKKNKPLVLPSLFGQPPVCPHTPHDTATHNLSRDLPVTPPPQPRTRPTEQRHTHAHTDKSNAKEKEVPRNTSGGFGPPGAGQAHHGRIERIARGDRSINANEKNTVYTKKRGAQTRTKEPGDRQHSRGSESHAERDTPNMMDKTHR
jgi:hypothetical protein